MKIHAIILVIFISLFTIGISSAEIYKWVDENGITHYSDSPIRDIPLGVEAENEAVPAAKDTPSDSHQSPPKAVTDTLDPEFFDFLDDSPPESVTAQAPTVEIYETEWCGYCKQAKNFFRSRGIEFTTYDIDKNPRAARRMKTMTNRLAVPFVVIDGKGIQGYSEQAYLQALQN